MDFDTAFGLIRFTVRRWHGQLFDGLKHPVFEGAQPRPALFQRLGIGDGVNGQVHPQSMRAFLARGNIHSPPHSVGRGPRSGGGIFLGQLAASFAIPLRRGLRPHGLRRATSPWNGKENMLQRHMNPLKPRLKYEMARRFRRELTPPEVRLWARLKGKPDGLHFRKQHPIGPYIVDFYCAAARLVVEVEGQIHNVVEVSARDEVRLAWLKAQGLEVMRLMGADIMRDPDEAALGVLLRAKDILEKT